MATEPKPCRANRLRFPAEQYPDWMLHVCVNGNLTEPFRAEGLKKCQHGGACLRHGRLDSPANALAWQVAQTLDPEHAARVAAEIARHLLAEIDAYQARPAPRLRLVSGGK